jgi:Na+/proline symporter
MTSINHLSVDTIVVYAFLLLTLVVGLWAGRNVKTIEDYALANRSYGTGTLILTFLATWIGGNFVMGYTQQIFEDGIIRVITALSQVISILFIAFFITPKIQQFTGCMTIGDLMEKFYGKVGRVVTAIAGLVHTIGILSIQIIALGPVCEWLGIGDSKEAMLLAAIIIIIYSSIGGIRSVTVTDVIQFVVLVVAIPLLANVVTKEAGGIKHVFLQIPIDKLTIWGHKKASYYWMTLVLATFPVGLLAPPYIQRLLMTKNQRQARDMYLSGAFFLPLLLALELLMAFSSLLAYPSVKSSQIIPNIISQLVPIGLKGFCIAGLLAVIMSSADSFLGSGGLLVSQSLIKPFFKKMGWSFNDLRVVRVVTLLMGLLSVVAAFNATSIANVNFYAATFLGSLVTIPLVAGILGLKTDENTFITACIFTAISIMISSLLLCKANNSLIFPIALGTNLTSFFLAHFIRYKGFRKADDTPVRSFKL